MTDFSANSSDAQKQFGGFEIIEKIGEGGMGTVYRAQQASLNRVVALKILAPHYSANQTYVESFRRESRAAARLHHPNLISVYDAGEWNGMQYYAMEFVEGDTLHRWLKRAGRLPEKTALDIAQCVAAALKYAWEKEQLIHRDVKPENIIIDQEGRVKLCDLGLAKTVGEKTELTLHGISLGTPHYLSPEQARGETNLDQRSDIYALGMTLYHTVTGQLPFAVGTAAAVMAKHLTEQVADPREWAPELSLPTCRFLEKLLAKNVNERYQSWDEVLSDLEHVQAGRMPLAKPLAPGKSTLGRNAIFEVRAVQSRSVATPTSEGKKSWAMIGGISVAIAAVILIAVLGAMGVFSKPPAPLPPPPEKPFAPPEQPRRAIAQAELEKVEQLIAANPQDIETILPRLRKITTEFGDTPSAGVAQGYIIQLAAQSFQQAAAFAQANPTHAEEITARFRKLAADFPDTPIGLAVSAQLAQMAVAPQEPHQVDPPAFPEIVKGWMQNAPEWLKQAFEKGNIKINWGEKKPPSPPDPPKPTTEEERLAAEQRRREEEQRRAEELKRQEEENARLAEQKRSEAEAARQKAEQRLRDQAAQLQAEIRYSEFARPFLGELKARNYAAATARAESLVNDAKLQPLQTRIAGTIGMARQLREFWKLLQDKLATLIGQEISLQGARGKVDEVTDKGIAIERMAGASVFIAAESISLDEWLMLAGKVMDTHEAATILALGLFSFAEGKMERAEMLFDQARTAGARFSDIQEAVNALAKINVTTEAINTLMELRRAVAVEDWPTARANLDLLRTKFAASNIALLAEAELARAETKLMGPEQQAAEEGAAKLFAELKGAVNARQWRAANEHYTQLTSRFGATQVVKQSQFELNAMRNAIELATGLVAGPDEDRPLREMVTRRGGQILIVNASSAAEARGPNGEPMFNDFARAMEQARDGDGIEVWDGVYRVGNNLKEARRNLLIYGRAGSLPVIQQTDPIGWWPKMFSTNDDLHLENLMLVGDSSSGAGSQNLFFKLHGDKLTTVRLRNCAIVGGGPTVFSGTKQTSIELDNCLLVNIGGVTDVQRGTQLHLSRCTVAAFENLFVVSPSTEKSVVLTINHSALAGGVITEERPTDWQFGQQMRRWRKWDDNAPAPQPIKNQVTFTGDRNFYVNAGAIVARKLAEEANLSDWRRMFFGQDLRSLAFDTKTHLDVFVQPQKGDFRLRPETAGARVAADGGHAGVRWPAWRWKSFQAKWQQLELKLPE